MQKINNLWTLKVGTLFATSFFVVATVILIGAPRATSISRADNCAINPTPVFNPYPIDDSQNTPDCTDNSFIRSRVVDSSGNPVGNSLFEPGSVTAQPGQEVQVVLYVHNGAIQNGDPSITTARNEQVAATVDLSQNSSHNVSATVTASNTSNSLNGNIAIETPSNSTLTLVPGTQVWYGGTGIAGQPATLQGNLNFVNNGSASLPDQQACFGYYRLIYFTVQVQAAPVVTPSGTISGTVNGQVGTQCLLDGTVSWSTQNVTSALVTVSNPSLNSDNYYDNDTVYSADPSNNSSDAPWLTPNSSYRFTLWAVVPAGTAGSTEHSFFVSGGSKQSYNVVELYETWLQAGSLNCGTTPPPTNPGPTNFTLTAANFCVGQDPSYSITGTANLVGQTITWSSTFNGHATGENNAYIGQTIAGNNGLATWSGVGGTWTTTDKFTSPDGTQLTGDVGNWTKTATIDGVSQTATFSVTNCNSTPAYQPVICSPHSQTAQTGQTVYFSATGGTGSYTWSGTGIQQASGNSTSAVYQTAGTYSASVTDGQSTDSCSTQVSAPAQQPTNFTLTAANFCVGQDPSYSITGTANLVNFPIVWSSTFNGQPTGENNGYIGQTIASSNGLATWSGVGSTWTTANIGPWTKTATISGVSQTATFSVTNCNPVTPPATLMCNPNVTQTAQTNQIVYFNATGGSGSYTWSAPQSNTTSGSGSNFSTSYASANSNGYLVTVKDTGGQSATCTTVITAPVVQVVQCVPGTQTVNAGSPVSFTATNGNGTYTWTSTGSTTSGSGSTFTSVFNQTGSATVTSNGASSTCNVVVNQAQVQPQSFTVIANSFCVGTNATYQFTGTANLAGLGVNASSVFTPIGGSSQTTNNGVIGTMQSGNGLSTLLVTGHTWQTSDIGHWVRTFTIGSAAPQTATFDVSSCGTPPVTLQCNPNTTQTVGVEQNVYFNATGGTAPYNWSASGTNQPSGSGTTYNTAYASAGNYQVRLTDSAGGSASCNVVVTAPTVQPVQCVPGTQTVNAGSPVSFTATNGNGTYTWTSTTGQTGNGNTFSAIFNQTGSATVTSNGQTATCNVTVNQAPPQQNNFTVIVNNFCVGSPATYQFTGTSGLANQPITAITSFTPTGGALQTTNNGQIGAMVLNGGLSSYTTTGHVWALSDVGHYQRVFTIDGVSQTATFDVVNCNPVTPTLMCNPNVTQTAQANQTVYFNATGGSGNYTWSAPSANQVSGSGASFSTSYGSSGNYSVNVSDGRSNAACNVLVSPPQTQQLFCNPNTTQTANVGQTVYFNAVGGNGQYTWSAPNAAQQNGNGTNFSTSYSSGGFNTVTVVSGDGQTASCSADIISQAPPQLLCSPVTQTGSVNTPVYFSSYGGTGTITWTAPGSNIGSGTGNSFNVSYGNSGNYSVTFTSGNGQTAVCNAYINPAVIQQNGYLTINKWVSNVNENNFSSSVTANSGDRVSYKIQVSAINGTVYNVQLSDYFSLPGNASYINGTLLLNGSQQPDSSFNNLSLGTLSQGQTDTVTYDAYVTATQNQGYQNSTDIVNTAQASGQNAGTVSASATVIISQPQVLGSNTNLTLSKSAWNNTKNANATQQPASKQDYITYTLTATNSGNSPATNFVITDDLSQVLPYADVTDDGGGTLAGNVISWPAQTVPAGGSVSVSFEVRVNDFLADNLAYTMSNTYGNTVTIQINTPQVLGAFTAPKTGADTDAFVFSGILMAGYAVYQKRKVLMRVILN